MYLIQNFHRRPSRLQALAGLNSARPASKTPHLPTFATSSPLGFAGAFEMAARARSAPLGRSKRPLEPARLHWSAQNGRSNSLGSAKALEIARPGCSKTLHLPTSPKSSPSAPLGRPTSQLGPARLRLAGDASLGRTTNACCAQHRDEHAPCMVCTGPH